MPYSSVAHTVLPARTSFIGIATITAVSSTPMKRRAFRRCAPAARTTRFRAVSERWAVERLSAWSRYSAWLEIAYRLAKRSLTISSARVTARGLVYGMCCIGKSISAVVVSCCGYRDGGTYWRRSTGKAGVAAGDQGWIARPLPLERNSPHRSKDQRGHERENFREDAPQVYQEREDGGGMTPSLLARGTARGSLQ